MMQAFNFKIVDNLRLLHRLTLGADGETYSSKQVDYTFGKLLSIEPTFPMIPGTVTRTIDQSVGIAAERHTVAYPRIC